jgi:hypothetical protein
MKGEFEMKGTKQEQRIRSPNTRAEQQEAIRRRAYQIYQQRGTGDGLDVEDWVQAEAELVNTQPTPKAA